ncbi:MAG TPA: lytic murein transglycosylase B [Candidatus Competibacteraceae bacterium]|nr:lytic murein transglycosylase B [Candidatus Competibacteraceae bacterium]
MTTARAILLLAATLPAAHAAETMAPVITWSESRPDTTARAAVAGSLVERAEVQGFIQAVAARHGLDRRWLYQVFGAAQTRPEIIATISKPAESKPWHAYRRIFLTEKRIGDGAAFWRQHAAALAQAERQYGVPAEIIVAILGVETAYGENTGGYRVLEALATLAFDYPKRADFFRKELEQFLLLAREEGIDPLSLKGSYAGAMGLAQFMPSSYRHYAVDFDGDGHRDLWRNPVDAIGSIANYLARNGWRNGEGVTAPATVAGPGYRDLLSAYSDLKPRYSYGQLRRLGVDSGARAADRAPALLLELAGETGPEYWVGFHNFYVITRYNRSPLYAMAAYQLGQEIRQRIGG